MEPHQRRVDVEYRIQGVLKRIFPWLERVQVQMEIEQGRSFTQRESRTEYHNKAPTSQRKVKLRLNIGPYTTVSFQSRGIFFPLVAD